ncbi:MAG TPA: pantoate--beta-alanine ligase, partial [Thermoanaerobaculia bacterium]|nr:pantoate--beta-alanine ligase [Thermoanaerobaculia bacterium]
AFASGGAGADAEPVRRAMREALAAEPAIGVEYAEIVDAASFRPLDRLPAAGRVVLPVAARVGGVRLIDNLHLDLPPAPAAGRSSLTSDTSGETPPAIQP